MRLQDADSIMHDSHSIESIPRGGLMHRIPVAMCVGVITLSASAQEPAPPKNDDEPERRLFSGQVVFLEDALTDSDVETYPETGRHVVLKTDDGELVPILADWRGRAFYQDEKLRDRKVELIGFFRAGLPYLNVLAIYTFDEEGHRLFTDYWCDICAFPMYQIQPCDCCQGDVRLRFQRQELPDYIRNPDADSADGAAAENGQALRIRIQSIAREAH